ncbi:hypothetical protein BTVI_110212 [Pitangus sulphuratus]|nr:hypothetical protein BTVI_110212 [Pitangus sulphuratus]
MLPDLQTKQMKDCFAVLLGQELDLMILTGLFPTQNILRFYDSVKDRIINLVVGGLTTLLLVIYWYRQGDLEPKFRNLIYYILFSIVMLCICANLYFHEVDK